ncbi:MAG: hypothetical protein ACI9G9_000508 [Psychromonas sp.]|jgi:hypothetical protein
MRIYFLIIIGFLTLQLKAQEFSISEEKLPFYDAIDWSGWSVAGSQSSKETIINTGTHWLYFDLDQLNKTGAINLRLETK